MASFTNGLATLGGTPGATAPSTIPGTSPGTTSNPGAVAGPSNQLFGSPGASSAGQAGKTGITQGPQLSLGAKGGSSLPSNASSIASSGIGGGKL